MFIKLNEYMGLFLIVHGDVDNMECEKLGMYNIYVCEKCISKENAI